MPNHEIFLPLFIGLPLAAALALPLVSGKRWWAPAGLLLLTMSALLALAVAGIGQNTIYNLGGISFPLGITLRLDGLSGLMLLIINIIGWSLALFSISYMRIYTDWSRYCSLFLLLVTGVNGVVLTGDLFNLYLFMEIASLASYALVGFGCRHDELEASFKYLVLGSVASSLIFLGLAVIYSLTGTFNFVQLSAKISGGSVDSLALYLSAGLLFCGFSLKAALVPFHAWLPDAHPSAPAPVSAMLSGVVIKTLGLYVLIRLLFNIFGISPALLQSLRVMGLLSMAVGILLALGQWDFKRLLAYSSVSQIGYVALGLGLGTPLGIAGALYHLANHSVFKSLLFLNAGSVEYSTGTRDLRQLGGLHRAMPVTGVTSFIASLSIAGVPPFSGFWSKLIIIIACVVSGHYLAAAVAVGTSLGTLALLLKVQKSGFFGTLKTGLVRSGRTPLLMGAAMVLLALLCLAMVFLAAGGFSTPYLIGPAVDVVARGSFLLY